MRRVVCLVLLAACGRISFDPRAGDGGATGDGLGIDGTFTGQQVTYIKASNTDQDDFFGSAVAVSADGNTIVVGAPGEDGSDNVVDGDQTDDGAADAGAAYVLVRTGSGWAYQSYLKADNADPADFFGVRVAISADGNTVAVAATQERSVSVPTDDSGTRVGAVYVFVRSGTTWQQQGFLKANNRESFDELGYSLAISGDGNTVVAGAPGEASALTGVDPANPNDNNASGAGAVYVFTRNGGVWAATSYIKASNTDPADQFGSAVAVSGDGSTLAVGAIQESSGLAGIGQNENDDSLGNSGAVYVFVRSGNTWVQQEYLKPSNPFGGGNFGFALSLSATGDALVVGARGESSPAVGIDGSQTNGGAFSSGAAYVFERSGTTWTQPTYVKATNTEAGDELGRSLTLSSNSQFVAVGAQFEASGMVGVPGDNSQTNAGAVYVYGRTATSWEPRAYLKMPSTAPKADDLFGTEVSFSRDGAVLAIGVSGEDGSGSGVGVPPDEGVLNSGAIMLFE